MLKLSVLLTAVIGCIGIASAQTCLPGQISCPDGNCIPSEWMCDGTDDCSGGWDEEPPCATPAPCNPDEFQCSNGKCIISSWECDGFADCVDGEDEHDSCVCEAHRCDDGQCIPEVWICDGTVDCDSDETACENGTQAAAEAKIQLHQLIKEEPYNKNARDLLIKMNKVPAKIRKNMYK